MRKRIYETTIATERRVKIRNPETGGLLRTEFNPVTAVVRVFIDADAVARELGRKAVNNKSGNATEIGGLVTVEVVSIRATE